jgi:ubiquinone/menaquinone biosynthesis C-methylase UbiE
MGREPQSASAPEASSTFALPPRPAFARYTPNRVNARRAAIAGDPFGREENFMRGAVYSQPSTPVSSDALERLYMVLGGHIYFQTLSAAVELRLFDLLHDHGELTRRDIARLLELEDQPTRILLLGCAALGLVETTGEAYFNSAVSETYLRREAPESLVPVVRWQNHINYRPMAAFLDALRANRNVGLDAMEGTGKTLYERLACQPELEQIFQDAMQAISTQANKSLVENVDLFDVEHLVDIGGGNGSNVIALANKFPHVRVTVFDSPSVCRIAEENFQDSEIADRASTAPGDCFSDPFPQDADCFMFCHFLTIWSECKNRELLKKAHDALPPGGKTIVFNMMQSDSEDGPLTAAMGSPYFLTLATGQGMLYTWNEYERWLHDAGFAEVQRRELPTDHGVLIATKP